MFTSLRKNCHNLATKKDKVPKSTPKWGRQLNREELVALLKKIYPDWKPDIDKKDIP